MDITIKDNLDIQKDVLVLGVFEEDKSLYKDQNKELSLELEDAIKNKVFELEFGKTYATKIVNSPYKRLLVVCLGKRSEFTLERLRRSMSVIFSYLKSVKLYSFTTNILTLVSTNTSLKIIDASRAASEGLLLSDYDFNKYKSKKDEKTYSATLQFDTKSRSYKELVEGMSQGRIIAQSTNIAKDLVNEPANVVTPEYLEKYVKQSFSKNAKIKIRVMNTSELEKEGLNTFLGVSKGSDIAPRLIFIQYNGAAGKPTAIVGKGITFDSGGYDIKPAGKFADMKCDMAGAAAVIGTIKAASELGLKKNILGVIPTCENLINGSAQKPGDIVKAYNGKTIEVGNTDAEGRLILADAISYAEKNYLPETIIDLATLTGSIVVALGFHYAGLFVNDDKLAHSLVTAGNDSNDRVWVMPFDKDYHDLMDGDISDLKNISKWDAHRAAGSITAAVFIGKFVEKAKWAHLDIAATAFLPEEKYYNQKYATGAGVRLLAYYFMQ